MFSHSGERRVDTESIYSGYTNDNKANVRALQRFKCNKARSKGTDDVRLFKAGLSVLIHSDTDTLKSRPFAQIQHYKVREINTAETGGLRVGR